MQIQTVLVYKFDAYFMSVIAFGHYDLRGATCLDLCNCF